MTLRTAIRAAVSGVAAPRAPWNPTRALTAITVGCGAVGVGLLVVHPEQWMVEQVTFVGNHQASVAELRHLADLPNGTLVWEVDLERVRTGVSQHPWVDDVDVAWAWPVLDASSWHLVGPSLQVTVSERRAVALLHQPGITSDGTPDGTPGRLWCVDEAGEPFLPASGADLDLPHLVGFGAELRSLHPDLQRQAIASALWLVDTLDQRGIVSRDEISEVVFDRDTGLRVLTGPARIRFGHADLSAEVDRLAILLSRGVSLDVPTEIDLASPTVALVRPLPAPLGRPGG